MARLPDGDPAPDDGALPASALEELAHAPLGVYVHVPFCATRCGYCDFNTYTAAELPGGGARAAFAPGAEAELALAAEVTVEANPESVDPRSLAALREAGFTRVSFGMQSAVAHVLAALDRVHTAG